MWAHVPQTPPTVIGNMMPYPTQPLQYQPCFMPPLQHTNHGMYFNSQVQSYSIVPQQYIPVANRGFRQHVTMGQPPNVPYIMHHDYVPVANSGFTAHAMGGAPSLHPQFVPSDLHTREALYEMSTVQQAHYVPQYPKPVQQIPAFVQRRPAIFNQQASVAREEREIPKILPNSEEQCGINVVHSLQEEQSSEKHKPVSCPRSDANTVAIVCEPAPTPLHLHLLDDTESMQTDVSHSPSETTLVPSPSSSDGVQTVCNSPPVESDTEEDELTATEDDQIPTKDTRVEVTLLPHSTVEVCYLDNYVEKLEPEQPYDNATIQPASNQERYNSSGQTKPLMKEELCSVQNMDISSSSLVTQGSEVTSKHSFSKDSAETCISSENISSANQNQRHPNKQSIRSLIDTPVYNTAHSRVLSQISKPNSSSARPHKGIANHPSSTTHFKQLFTEPVPFSTKKDDKGS